MQNDNIITFIIPTIGRETLKNTLISLQNQTIENWNAIIIFDGCNQNINNIDDDGFTPLLTASKYGNLKSITFFKYITGFQVLTMIMVR